MNEPATQGAALKLRWLVAPGEGRALLGAGVAHFFLLCGYYMLRSLRETLALDAGSTIIPYLFWIVFLVMLGLLPMYWWLVARVPRDWLPRFVYGFVAALFLGFAVLTREYPGHPVVGVAYFIAVTTVNLFMVSVFWSIMADVWRSQNAKRLFGFIAAGGSVGALAGPALNASLVVAIDIPALIFVACMMLLGAGALVTRVQWRRARDDAAVVRPPEEAVGGRAWDDLRRLVHSRYLLVLMIVVIAGQCLAAFMYNEQAKLIEMTYTNRLERAEIFAQLDLAVSALSLILQATVVGWLTTRGGLRLSLSAVPVLLALSFSALALVPTAAMLLITQVARRATDYGLSKPTREMLFTVLNPESKFKSKSLIDTVLQRGADSVGNGLYLLVAGLGLAGISWLCALLSVLMIFATWWLGGSFGRNEGQAGRP